MKKLALGFFFTLGLNAYGASALFPQVLNFGTSVQVTLNNFTDEDVRCSGIISMHGYTGYVETQYYSELIVSGTTSFRTYRMARFNERISFVNHNIFCNKAN